MTELKFDGCGLLGGLEKTMLLGSLFQGGRRQWADTSPQSFTITFSHSFA